LIQSRIDKFPASGEINRTVRNGLAVLQGIEDHYKGKELITDHIDGLSMEFDKWRFNLRPSNTEPVIRLNVETRADKDLLKEKTDELIKIIDSLS
jgi:phosphomannomutase